MKFECPKRKIEEIINKAEKVTSKNAVLPVLKCILIQTKGKSIILKATNLDLGVEFAAPVRVDNEGSVAVPGNILHSFVSNLSDDENLLFETIQDNLKISTPSTSTLIKTLPVDDFPIIPRVEDGDMFTIGALELVKGLKSVWWSAAVSSMKPELSSVYIYTTDDNLVFVATDSFRLAEKKMNKKVSRDFGHILIPVKNVSEIIRMLEGVNEEVEISVSKNQISFSFQDIFLVSRIVDGVFPDYKQLIPQDFKTEAIMLKEDLISTLKLAGIFSNKFNQINFKADLKSKSFKITTKNSDIGESINKLDAALTGDDIDLNVVHKYITDCFQAIDSDSISLQFNGPGKPVAVRGATDKTFTYIVMPMNK